MQAFKLFLKFVQIQFHSTVKVVQFDYGENFIPFTEFLKDLGITHRLRCPNTSHQNGYVERKHRHIMEMSLTPLLMLVSLFTSGIIVSPKLFMLLNRFPLQDIQNITRIIMSCIKKYPSLSK